MYVKLQNDWFGMRAGRTYEIGRGVGEILILRNFATPADGPEDTQPEPTQPKPKRKRVKRARTNRTANAAGSQSG